MEGVSSRVTRYHQSDGSGTTFPVWPVPLPLLLCPVLGKLLVYVRPVYIQIAVGRGHFPEYRVGYEIALDP